MLWGSSSFKDARDRCAGVGGFQFVLALLSALRFFPNVIFTDQSGSGTTR